MTVQSVEERRGVVGIGGDGVRGVKGRNPEE